MVDLRQKRARYIELSGLEHALIKVTTVSHAFTQSAWHGWGHI